MNDLKKNVWIVNPFDQLPFETNVELRYKTLCNYLLTDGYKVTWWSSNFNHLTKSFRTYDTFDEDELHIKLISSPAYKKNISLRRFLSHFIFSLNIYKNMLKNLQNSSLPPPTKIIVSNPPLETSFFCIKIRDYIKSTYNVDCEVVVDVMDAWPEVYYSILPRKLKFFSKVIFSPFHLIASYIYRNADKITTVGNSYSKIVNNYASSSKFISKGPHLCYHGSDINESNTSDDAPSDSLRKICFCTGHRYNASYIGTLGAGYDIESILNVSKKWLIEDSFPFQFFIAGAGEKLDLLKKFVTSNNLDEKFLCDVCLGYYSRVNYLGYLNKQEMNFINNMCDVAIVPNKPSSYVACPYKVSEYSASKLAMVSCLGGELLHLLQDWNCGTSFTSGDVNSFENALLYYYNSPDILEIHKNNSFEMAKNIFDKKIIYPRLIDFINS